MLAIFGLLLWFPLSSGLPVSLDGISCKGSCSPLSAGWQRSVAAAATALKAGDMKQAEVLLAVSLRIYLDSDQAISKSDRAILRSLHNNLAVLSYLQGGSINSVIQQINLGIALSRSGSSDLHEDDNVLKNLAWLHQVSNQGDSMRDFQRRQWNVVTQRQVPPEDTFAVSFFDLGLTGGVCAKYQQGQARALAAHFDPAAAYLDLLKRALTNFLQEELPHELMPWVEWDLYYRMRDSQNNPPSGMQHGHGLTTLAVGSLDLVQAAMEQIFAERIPGDILEAGVWRGGLAILMHALLKTHGQASKRLLWAADSYAGIPQVPHDAAVNTWEDRYAVSKAAVMENFVRFGLLDDRVMFLEGVFSESLVELPERLALVHADGDAYDSTMDILVHSYPRLSLGGYVIIDDFHLPGCRAAVIEYRRMRNITEALLPVPHDYVMTCRRGVGTVVDLDRGAIAQGPRSAFWKRRADESELLPLQA